MRIAASRRWRPASRLERGLVAILERDLAVDRVRPIHLGPAFAPDLCALVRAMEFKADIRLALGAVQGRDDGPEAKLAPDTCLLKGDEGGFNEI